MKSHK